MIFGIVGAPLLGILLEGASTPNRNSMQPPPSLCRRTLRSLAVCFLLFLPLGGCSTVAGLATGAITGFVDLPSTMMAGGSGQVDNPDFYAGALFLAPIGLVWGPFVGFLKGLALDVSWITGQVSYGDVFGSYSSASVWRPYKWDWTKDR